MLVLSLNVGEKIIVGDYNIVLTSIASGRATFDVCGRAVTLCECQPCSSVPMATLWLVRVLSYRRARVGVHAPLDVPVNRESVARRKGLLT